MATNQHGDFFLVIQKFFTCEGRFDTAYQYYFRLLLHFTGRQPMDILFYLFRSLEKMVDTTYSKGQQDVKYKFSISVLQNCSYWRS